MPNAKERQIYEDFGITPIINASGNLTILGGSRVSSNVQTGSALANRYYVDMETLLRRTGEKIASLLEAEAALVTSGCYTAIALGAAACMTADDRTKMEQLPDTTGLKHEFITLACQDYKYNRALSIFGGKIVAVGDEEGATASQVREAITDRTAGFHYLLVGPLSECGLPFETFFEIAQAHNLPVIADAASLVYPLDDMLRYNRMGVDLVCYGAKYVGGYNGTGILCGRKDLLEAAFLHSFIGFEKRGIRSMGRGMKLDRQEIIGVTIALQEWLTLDHEERIAEQEQRSSYIQNALGALSHIQTEWVSDVRTLASAVQITLDEGALGKTAAQVSEALKAGDPSIWVLQANNTLLVSVSQLMDGEEEIVAERLKAEL